MVNTIPALFASYSLVPGLKKSLPHSEQMPFSEHEANVYFTRALEQCNNDHYIFVKVPGLRVTDFQNFSAWTNLRNRLVKASTIFAMPNVLDGRGVSMTRHNDEYEIIKWEALESTLENYCDVMKYNIKHMNPEEFPKYQGTRKILLKVEVFNFLEYEEVEDNRIEFLQQIDELIRDLCRRFPTPKFSILLAGTTSTEVKYDEIADRDEVIEFHEVPDDPKVLSVAMREKVRKSKRVIFPDITVFDKSRYFEYDRSQFHERPSFNDLKENQWVKDMGKGEDDLIDDTWLEKKTKKIVKDEKLYKFGENEEFVSVFANKQFVRDNSLLLASATLLFVVFVSFDILRGAFLAIKRILNSSDVKPKPSKKSVKVE